MEPTSLKAVAAWTPACSVGSARWWLVLWSMAAVLVPSRVCYTMLRSLLTYVWYRVSRLVPCCGQWQQSSYQAASATPHSGRCRRLSGTVHHACLLVTFWASLAAFSFTSGLPLDITTNCNNWQMVNCCCILLRNIPLQCFSPSVLWRCWLGGRKGIRPVKNWVVVLAWLFVWSQEQICIWPSWCHCHSLSVAPIKSRLVLPFWYRLTWVVPDKGLLNVCAYILLHNLFV